MTDVRNLEILDLAGNELVVLEEDSLAGLVGLKSLGK